MEEIIIYLKAIFIMLTIGACGVLIAVAKLTEIKSLLKGGDGHL